MENVKVPIASQAEDVLLGGIISDPHVYESVMSYVNEEILYKQESKILWNKVGHMIKAGNHVDLVTISESLTEGEKSAGVTPYYLSGLFEYAVGKELAVVYAKSIYEKYLLRLIIDRTSQVRDLAHSNHAKTYDVLTDTHSLIGELIEVRPGETFDIVSTMDDVVNSIEIGETNLIKTGFSGLDELSGGMTRGEITIVGGRPGHGKTTFTINLIKGLVESGKKVALFNREMTNVEMLKKLIALES